MDIVVCVKRVAATDSKIKVGADGKSIDPAGVEFVLNPYDEIAIAQALLTKEAAGGGTITVVTLGSGDAQKELRTCLAMGADKAVLIDDGGRVEDPFSTAAIVANYIKGIACDLVLCGKQAVDGDDNQFAGRLAALLDLPCLSEVSTLELADGKFTAQRDIEGGREVVSCATPCVISANKALAEPKYANLKGIMAAKKKPLETIPAEEIAPATELVSLELPPERPEGKILDSVDALVAALKNEAKVI